MKTSAAVIGLLAVIAFATGLGLSALREAPTPVVATVFDTPRELPQVELSDHRGDVLTRDRFAGGWDILFFGFTQCPDICPTTLFRLAGLRDSLADLPVERRPRIWLVSVDPRRDTPEILAAYLSAFGPGFAGVTGTPQHIAQFTGELGVAWREVPQGDDYTIAHTSALFLVDPEARLAGLITAPEDYAAIEADYRLLTR